MFDGAPRYGQITAFLTGETDVVPPGITLENDRPEFLYLGHTSLMGSSASVVSAAGTIASCGLFNLSKNSIGIVTLRRWSSSAVRSFFLRFFRGAGLPGGFSANASGPVDTRDSRLISPSGSQLVCAQAALAAATGGQAFGIETSSVAFAMFEDREPIVLGPGTALIFEDQAVGAQTLNVSWRWYERGARAEELAAL